MPDDSSVRLTTNRHSSVGEVWQHGVSNLEREVRPTMYEIDYLLLRLLYTLSHRNMARPNIFSD